MYRTLTAAVLLLVVPGCALTGARASRLEARLRVQGDQLSHLQRELEKTKAEADRLRAARAESGVVPASHESGGGFAGVTSVAFASLVTGGRNEDGVPGHEKISALVQPLDETGDLIKSAGELEVELLDLAGRDEDRAVARWTFDEAELTELWESGLFGSGFRLSLRPDRVFPKEAILVAHFKTSDGRQLDASKTLRLEPQGEHESVSGPGITPASFEQTADALADLVPDELPVREAPSDSEEESNPFAAFLQETEEPPVRTSDVFTTTDRPVYR